MKKSFIAVISSVIGMGVGAGAVGKVLSDETKKYMEYSQKHLSLYLMMNQWVKVKQENKSISKYLSDRGFKKIVIYGMNYVGETLFKELNGSDVEVEYAIDKNAESIYADIDILSPNDILKETDAVIVTAITYFDEIEETLSEKMNCPIFSLEDILYEL